MRIMTKVEEKVLDDLVRLAQGNISLVEEAFHFARTQEKPDLADVVGHIKKRVIEKLKGQHAA
jgi:hypothetical protein